METDHSRGKRKNVAGPPLNKVKKRRVDGRGGRSGVQGDCAVPHESFKIGGRVQGLWEDGPRAAKGGPKNRKGPSSLVHVTGRTEAPKTG